MAFPLEKGGASLCKVNRSDKSLYLRFDVIYQKINSKEHIKYSIYLANNNQSNFEINYKI